MNERNMDPWDRDSYETGSTQPPKSRSGLVAFLLVAVILLAGITTALGVMNVRMFQQLKNDNSSMSFMTGSVASQPVSNPGVDVPVPPTSGGVSVELQPAPSEPGSISYAEVYEKSIPSVVSIICTTPNGTASGTGVVLSANGYIVTNCHVIENAQSVQVQFTDGRIMSAYLVGADEISDLAVLYVAATDLIPAEFGDSSTLRVGEPVAAIGDPLGPEFRGTMTDGIVSAINRNITTGGRTMTLIQTNAALNSGNSGGPLINGYGQVVGINTMKIGTFVDEAGVEGLGFAIPSTTVKEIVDQLIAQGYVSGRPEMKITCETVTPLDQRFYGLPAGVLVVQTEEDGCAAKAGITASDIILSFNGIRVETVDELSAAMYACKVGQPVEVTLYRYRTSSELTVTVILEEAEG